jgi:phosphodiesterase/alkaline phosphatase D-like protein
MLPMGGRAAGGRVDAGVFQHGVASGDPLHDRVVLWTRVTPPEGLARVRVDYVVTRDPALTDVVLAVRLLTTASRDFTVKPDVSGLQPGTSYCYAFTAQGEMSAVGRTRTLPVCAVDRLRMAVTSCSNHPAGYFNAYARIAERADLADIVMLETRLKACSQQLEATIPVPGLGNAFQQQGEFLDPSRTLLGERQEVWLAGKLRTSRAGWKCIGQQLMFGQLKAQGAPLAAGGGLFFNADQWDGYQPARDRVYDIIKGTGRRRGVDNVVVLTGDIHRSFANDLSQDPNNPDISTGGYDAATGQGSRAVEFVTTSMTSPGLNDPEGSTAAFVRSINPHMKFVDFHQRGHLLVDVTPSRVVGVWWHVDRVDQPDDAQRLAAAFEVRDGASRLQLAEPTAVVSRLQPPSRLAAKPSAASAARTRST